MAKGEHGSILELCGDCDGIRDTDVTHAAMYAQLSRRGVGGICS